MDLYVSNLGDEITDESLRAIFATHWAVNSYKIIKHHVTGESRGFAFIDMPNDREAQKAIERIDGMVVNGRNVSVKQAKPGSETESSMVHRLNNYWETRP